MKKIILLALLAIAAPLQAQWGIPGYDVPIPGQEIRSVHPLVCQQVGNQYVCTIRGIVVLRCVQVGLQMVCQ